MSFSCQMQYYVMTCDSTWVRTECNSSLPFQKHHPRGTQDKFPGSSSKVISWVEVCMLPDISWSCSLKDGLPVDYFVSHFWGHPFEDITLPWRTQSWPPLPLPHIATTLVTFWLTNVHVFICLVSFNVRCWDIWYMLRYIEIGWHHNLGRDSIEFKVQWTALPSSTRPMEQCTISRTLVQLCACGLRRSIGRLRSLVNEHRKIRTCCVEL